MKAAVCTLFEGHYHYGVAALVNSLHAHGFRGTVWAGYRGELPPWAAGATEYPVADGLTIRFLPLKLEAHFANFKPAFMREVLERHDREADAVCYFDPDIVVAGPWRFYQEWLECGVALCEDVNSPVPETHPLRAAWRKFCLAKGAVLKPRTASYVNSGFVGAPREHLRFLSTWADILGWMEQEIGSANYFHFGGRDRTYLFYRGDQDALNMCVEASDAPVSVVGKEGMGFSGGGYIMYHSLGAPKPWRKHFLGEALKGWPPTAADKAFLAASEGPIAAWSRRELAARRGSAFLAGAICRLVRKGGW